MTSSIMNDLVSRLLAQALVKVKPLGWQQAVVSALRENGLSDQGSSLFHADDLVRYHYDMQLISLRAYKPQSPAGMPRLRELLLKRLEGNAIIGFQRLHEAQKLSLTRPFSTPFNCLSKTSDELWYLAGDRSTDTKWYTRRGSLLGVYAACEAFQARDSSRDFRDTRALSKRLVHRLETVEYAKDSVAEWLKFNARGAFNVARTLI